MTGRISTNRKFMAITRWTSPLLAIAIVIGSGSAMGASFGWGQLDGPTQLSGVYTVSTEKQVGETPEVDEQGKNSGARKDGSNIRQIAFSQFLNEGKSRVAVRLAAGGLQYGQYSIDQDTVTLQLYPVRDGAQGPSRDYVSDLTFTFAEGTAGDFRLMTDSTEVYLHSDEERRFLFDRDFSWEPRTAVNR